MLIIVFRFLQSIKHAVCIPRACCYRFRSVKINLHALPLRYSRRRRWLTINLVSSSTRKCKLMIRRICNLSWRNCCMSWWLSSHIWWCLHWWIYWLNLIQISQFNFTLTFVLIFSWRLEPSICLICNNFLSLGYNINNILWFWQTGCRLCFGN